MLYKISAAGRSKQNVCRNLHRLIHREGFTLPLDITFICIPVRKRRPMVSKVKVFYPVICPSTWMSFLLKEQSYLILGGIDVKEPHKWQALLCDFWQKYLLMDKAHVMHKYKSEATLSCTVPLYLHGDEGRGKYKLPVMVEAVQGVISWKGVDHKNSSGPHGLQQS